MREVIGPISIVGLGIAIVIWAIWFNYRYPCIQYQAVFVEEYVTFYTQRIDDNTSIVLPDIHPAHWEQKCMQRGDRKAGDREASYARIPAEREK